MCTPIEFSEKLICLLYFLAFCVGLYIGWMEIMVDYYKILDVPQSASMNDIKRAYRSKVLRWHPDKNPENRKEAEQKFKEIVEAYKVLSDKSTRDHYDGSSKDSFKGTKRSETEKHLSVFDQDGIKIFFTGQRCSSDFSVSFFSAPKRFHHFSIMTAVMNGKKITTKRHLENESKYLEVEEDGKTVSIHVNGIPVYDRESNSPTGNEWDYRLDKGYYCPDKWHLWTCERRRWADEWRRWANKWRDWAEECRDCAEERYHQQDKGSTGVFARHHRRDAAEHHKANEEHPRSDKGCPNSRGKFPGFSMPREGKWDLKEGHSKTGKGQSWLEEECSRTDKGYFMFPKPGEKNSGMDEGLLKTNKKQHRPEEGQPLLDKSNPGFSRPGEGHPDQDQGHGRTKEEQPRPEEGQSKLDKVQHGLQKPEQGSPTQKKKDHGCIVSPMKHKADSEYNSQAGSREPHTEKQEQQPEERPRAVKNQNTLGKSELKDEKLEPKRDKTGSTLESQSEKGTGLSGMRKNTSANTKLDSKAQLSCGGTTGLPLKRKEAQIRTRKPYTKGSKSRAGRNRSYSNKSKSQAGKIRMPDGHSKGEHQVNDSSNSGGEVALDGKKTSADCKGAPQSRKKAPLPTSQEGEIPLLTKKRLLRRRAHYPPSETRAEKHNSISETSQLLDINGQRRGRVIKLPRPSAQLPSLRGQKFAVNQLPDVNR